MKNRRLFRNLLLCSLMAEVIAVRRLISRLSGRHPKRQEVTLPTVDGLELTTWVYVN
jgi:hypothetical protein